jgi:hypothetical protein
MGRRCGRRAGLRPVDRRGRPPHSRLADEGRIRSNLSYIIRNNSNTRTMYLIKFILSGQDAFRLAGHGANCLQRTHLRVILVRLSGLIIFGKYRINNGNSV